MIEIWATITTYYYFIPVGIIVNSHVIRKLPRRKVEPKFLVRIVLFLRYPALINGFLLFWFSFSNNPLLATTTLLIVLLYHWVTGYWDKDFLEEIEREGHFYSPEIRS